MLLVTFHGGTKGINNIYGFSTSGKPSGKPQTEAALSAPKDVTLDELRGMAVWGGNLFVVNGDKHVSSVLVFRGPPRQGPQFDYLDTVIGPGQSIMHPFGIAFDSPQLPANCYVSNQDSNVVARVSLTAGTSGTVNGSLCSGCQSNFLTTQYPPPDTFLDGTFVASQNGDLAGVTVVAPNVSPANGGLGVTFKNNSDNEPQNSVRDVAIAGGILFVCDEVDSQIKMYDLNGGAPLGSGSANGLKHPTHLAISGRGLWVSSETSLFWSPLPSSISGASLSLLPVEIDDQPKGNKIGGIAFDDSGNVYVVFQDGTGKTGSGSIEKYLVMAGAPPSLSQHETFAKLKNDTPEFCLWVSDSKWPSS